MVSTKNLIIKKSSQKFLAKFFSSSTQVRSSSSQSASEPSYSDTSNNQTGTHSSTTGSLSSTTGSHASKTGSISSKSGSYSSKTGLHYSHSSGNESQHDLFKFYSDKRHSGYNYRQLRESDYEKFISKRSALREPAITRQITSLAYKVGKEFISLAEGMPNDEIFPFKRLSLQLKDGNELVLEGKQLASALQYLPTQGQPELLRELHKFQQDLHRPPHYEDRDILVTSGSQYGIYAAVELLVNYGDPVLMNAHTYTGFHAVLKPYQPEIIEIPEDEGGTIPEYLENILTERQNSCKPMPRMMYLVPTGSNPSGAVLSEERRRKIYDLACKFDFIIVEDDPYMFMNYTGIQVPSLLSLDEECRVLRLDSLSKVLSPGLRVGWVTAPRPLLQRIELHLQADHLHACSVGQAVLNALLSTWGRSGLASQLVSARTQYHARAVRLHAALQRHVTTLATWRAPQAGCFIWLRLNVDDVYQMVFQTAFEKGLMLIPGQACSFNPSLPSQYLRLAFSKVRMEDMDEAARLLAEIIRTEQKKVGVSRLHGTATQH